ncbi:hypothetical protein KPL74_06565 [Bacillus sp. NP157]|nr:hypothetical protein KPL74_06565 [Bacillus sp. NP157]
MEREIKIGNATFVVEDPAGSLDRPPLPLLHAGRPSPDTERTPSEEAWPFSATPKPNASDPMGEIAARVAMFDGIANGRISPRVLFVAWLWTALTFYTLAAVIFCAGTMPATTVGVLILAIHTGFFLRARSLMHLHRKRRSF